MSTRTRPSTTADSPRRPRLDRRTAMRLAAEEYRRLADTLAALGPADWQAPTPCPAWDVRAMAAHAVGMAAMAASIRDGARQQRLADQESAAQGIAFIDALTALQVRERESMTPDELVADLRRLGPRATRGRRLTPGLIRRRTMPQLQEVNGRDEPWTLGYLVDVILTRDPWMHRMDVAEATGGEPVLTPEHDGTLVADVVAEWGRRHGSPYRLTLTGPAGGRWAQGTDGPALELDAVEFCRILSGRRAGEGLLATQVPF